MEIAKIAVSAATFAIDKPYSYAVPEGMTLSPGQRVEVSFGRGNRRTEGIVLTVEAGDAQGLKPVERCLDGEPVLSQLMLHMAAFLRERYFCTFFDAARVMLPAGLWFREKEIYSLVPDSGWQEQTCRRPEALAIMRQLEELGGRAELSALRAAAPREETLREELRYLTGKGWIRREQSFQRKTGDKSEQVATLAASPEEAMAYAQRRPRSAAMQRAVLETLCAVGSVSVKELCYFTGAQTATVRRLEKLGYLTLTDRPVLRCREIVPAKIDGPLVLSQEQQAAFDGLCAQMRQSTPGTALLHGVTGSGKTAVYLRLIRACLEDGRSALLLVPEIALTPQLLGLLAAHLGDQVAVLHSGLPASERYDQWKRIRSGQARVVAGTRSAIFAPCGSLGLIIIDEEQEHSYKSENSPRYCAVETGLWRGRKEHALVLLGSATPTLESMYRAKSGLYSLYTLTGRYNGTQLPGVEIVDMRRELEDGNDSVFSRALVQAIRETAEAGKQTVLLLNRRGNSRALVCVDCREAPECPRCSARLTYHSANQRLMCHYCGYSQPVPERCPRCGGPLKTIGCGTQKAQQELEALLPGMEILRMDTDTVSAVHTHEKILEHFQADHVPVLLGTQMVAKGLNLPNVTLVGVLDGDLGLYAGSFRASETTFDMLTQVVGRAGRGDTPGRAIIQTLSPENPVITLAAAQDYAGFYELELPLRQMQKLPPFGDLVTLTVTGPEEGRVLRGAGKLRDSLLYLLRQEPYCREPCGVLGPAPCPVPKINYHFRYWLTLRCRLTRPLGQLIAHLLRQFAQDRENRGISAFADVNGFD